MKLDVEHIRTHILYLFISICLKFSSLKMSKIKWKNTYIQFYQLACPRANDYTLKKTKTVTTKTYRFFKQKKWNEIPQWRKYNSEIAVRLLSFCHIGIHNLLIMLCQQHSAINTPNEAVTKKGISKTWNVRLTVIIK